MIRRFLRVVVLALPTLSVAAPAQTPAVAPAPPPAAQSATEVPAGCVSLADATRAAAATRGPGDRSAIQAGLRVYFGADTGFLSDGIIGPVTASFLEQLCSQVPLVDGTDPVTGTLDIARAFGVLSGQSPNWRSRLLDPAFLEPAPGLGLPPLRLAAGAESAALLFDASATADALTCGALSEADLSSVGLGSERVQAGITALVAADPGLPPLAAPLAEPGLGPLTRGALATLCPLYPVAGGPGALAMAMDRLGAIETARPGALALIASVEFSAWIASEPVRRAPRLLASPPAALALLAEFRGEEAPPQAGTGTEGPVCRRSGTGADLTYFAFTQADLEALAARTGIRATLQPVAEQRFALQDDVLGAVTEALALTPGSCPAQVAADIFNRHAETMRVYSLDPEAVKSLALKPDLAPTLGALADLAGIEATSREELEAAVEAAVRATVAGAEGEAAGAAADVAAAAAEDVTPASDMAAPDFDFFAPEEQPQQFAITDSSMLMIEAEITDKQFFEAINATPYKEVQSREMIRADMLLALRPVVAARTDAATDSQLAAILETVRQQWRLTEPVITDLALEPEFAAVSPAVQDAARRLTGISYPNERLFDLALESLAPPPDAEARAVFDAIARKRIDDPYARRVVAPISADCGCNVTRQANAVVYGFYPFWFLPQSAEAPLPQVDFETVSRLAFDGLAIDASGQIRYAAQWRDAGATFVASVHRHEAKADVAVRLSGWRNWSDDARRTAADSIERLLRPQPEDGLQLSGGPLGGLDRLLSRRPDGVTLQIEDYDGRPGSPDPQNLRSLVRTLAERLSGSGQSINLAFDIPLVSGADPDAPLFRDLHDLIVNTEEPEARLVDNILVFLERPTSEAKKRLRARVEGSFHGEERIQVLRAIIPVVPAGAHAPLDHSHAADPDRGGQEVTSAKNSYGQFDDDLVYFQDNFDGVGFWPTPVVGATLPDGSPDRLAEIVQARYYAWTPAFLPRHYAHMLRAGSDRVCRLVCPNRIAFYGLTLGVVGLAAGFGLLTFYSGRLRSLCETLLLVPILLFVALGLLVLIAICDAGNRQMAIGAAGALVTLMCAAAIFGWYERRLDGPMP